MAEIEKSDLQEITMLIDEEPKLTNWEARVLTLNASPPFGYEQRADGEIERTQDVVEKRQELNYGQN